MNAPVDVVIRSNVQTGQSDGRRVTDVSLCRCVTMSSSGGRVYYGRTRDSFVARSRGHAIRQQRRSQFDPRHDSRPRLASERRRQVSGFSSAASSVVWEEASKRRRLNRVDEKDTEGDITPRSINAVVASEPLPDHHTTVQQVVNIEALPSLHEHASECVYPTSTDICCWYDAHPFEGQPVGIPVRIEGRMYFLDGYFCSFSCAAAYINSEMNNIGPQKLMVRLNELHRDVQRHCLQVRDEIKGQLSGTVEDRRDKTEWLIMWSDHIKNTHIQPAPARRLLKKFGGTMDIEAFRAVGNKSQLFPVVVPEGSHWFPLGALVYWQSNSSVVPGTFRALARKHIHPRQDAQRNNRDKTHVVTLPPLDSVVQRPKAPSRRSRSTAVAENTGTAGQQGCSEEAASGTGTTKKSARATVLQTSNQNAVLQLFRKKK